MALLALAGTVANAQDLGALRSGHTWDAAPAWSTEWDERSIGTEVLSDELSIRLRNTKPQFMAAFFERTRVIRFGDEADIMRHGRFVVPESLDPPSDMQRVRWTQRTGPVRTSWYNVRLDRFAARILRPDGSWTEVPVLGRVERNEVMAMRTLETSWSYVLDLVGISPGDVVQVSWKYMVPYNMNGPVAQGWRSTEWVDNWSLLTNWRVFFHDVLPIREQTVSIAYDLRHGAEFSGTACSEFVVEGNTACRKWMHMALPGCMDEVNARPAADLPHIVIRMELEDRLYLRRDRFSGVPMPQPYWLTVLRARESRALWWKRVAQKRVPDRQNRLLNEFVEQLAGHIPDSLATDRMEVIHEHIAEHAEYEPDRLWYQGNDRSLARFGDQLTAGRIRDMSRYDLYAKLANAVEAPYVTAYVMDKRAGGMNDTWMSPLWNSEFLFGFKHGQGVSWMHPKRMRIGRYADELPFYWQGTDALLMNMEQLVSDLPAPPLFIQLPTADANANVRATELSFMIDPDRPEATGTVRTLLSGQFSTLGRAAYHAAAIDSLVDPRYGRLPWDPKGITPAGPLVMEAYDDPPFRFQAERSLHIQGAAVRDGTGGYSMDLARFIAHVVPTTVEATGRDLPFYWDFAQRDRVIIDLHFTRPFEVMDLTALTDEVASGGARYTLTATRISAQHLRVESYFEVITEREEVPDAPALEVLCASAQEPSRMLHLRFPPEGP